MIRELQTKSYKEDKFSFEKRKSERDLKQGLSYTCDAEESQDSVVSDCKMQNNKL